MNSGKMKERQMPRKLRNKRNQRRSETEQKYKQQAEGEKKERKGRKAKRRTRRRKELDEEKKTCRVEGRQSGQSAFRSPIERGGVGMSYTISGLTGRDERYTKPNED